MQNLTFTLTIEEANTILTALSKLPFEAVSGLIPKLQSQAQAQLSPPQSAEPLED